MGFDRRDGQYMVEFALAFSVFVVFVLFVIDIGLMIYNHNLFYRAVAESARTASLGRSNAQIGDKLWDQINGRYFPTLLTIANPEQMGIEPQQEILRVDGQPVTVSLDSEFGMSTVLFGELVVETPIRSTTFISQRNDLDRDGCKDSLEGTGPSCDPGDQTFGTSTAPRDHDNDGTEDTYIFDGDDDDADGDGIVWDQDVTLVGYVDSGAYTGYVIHRPGYDPGVSTPTTSCATPFADQQFTFQGRTFNEQYFETCFDGEYHAPELWSDNIEAPSVLFPRVLPNWNVLNNGSIDNFFRLLWTEHDADNDGWEDKYDGDDDNAQSH